MKNAIRVGPLALVGAPQARNLTSERFTSITGGTAPSRSWRVVVGDQEVTFTVPSSQRRTLALHDPNAQANRYGFLFSSGDPSVTFEACSGVDVNYNGGFIAKHPICAELQIQTATSSRTATLAVGKGSCR